MKPHKHAELIKAWADGAEIQLRDPDGNWIDVDPLWCEQKTYRIKPKKRIVWIVGPENMLLHNGFGGTMEYRRLKHSDQLIGLHNPQIIWLDDWWKHVPNPIDLLTQVMVISR